MNRFLKPVRAAVILLALVALTSCSLGQAATPSTPTVDINAVKTAAAATAIVELTKIASQASPTPAPTQTPTTAPATPTLAATAVGGATQGATLLPTATVVGAAGLPATETPVAPMAGTAAPIPSLTPIVPVAPTSAGPTCLNAKFVADITVPDKTVMQPGQKFTKIWEIQNTGTCPWDEGYGFVRWAGPDMGGADIYYSKNDTPVQPGGIVDMSIDMRAPYQPGDYIAHWVMVSDSGQTFGQSVVVEIIVK